eukprot:2476510-Amphidinium_carterae.2
MRIPQDIHREGAVLQTHSYRRKHGIYSMGLADCGWSAAHLQQKHVEKSSESMAGDCQADCIVLRPVCNLVKELGSVRVAARNYATEVCEA